ncbi:MAG: hypothetical protein QOK05_1823 [Chloroflexota bacterium]|jgi:4-amino-4-deoxy-L-arabinose transferase-like glycosyltransferase|nr:hypothetical protein [Chloroflexota bacterium]
MVTSRERSSRGAVLLYAGAAAVLVGVHLTLNRVLGFHIDELYYIASGRHPAFGYVDFPPVVPLLARFETDLLGATPWTLRLLPALVGGVNALLCGAYARRLGGSLSVQALALLVGITSPAILGTWLFQTVVFDQLTWMVALYLFLTLVLEPKPRTWLLLGLALGVGLEVKYTIVALIAGMAIAVVVTPRLRGALRTPYPWLAAAIILLTWLPNLAWQAATGFPTLAYTRNHAGGGIGDYVLVFVVILFLLAPLWVAGLISVFRNRQLRAVGIACIVPFAVFLFGGKGYYAAPAVPIVMVQGLMAISRLERRRLRSGLVGAVVIACVLNALVLAKLVLPVIPPDQLHATGFDRQNTDFALTVGWPSIAAQVSAAYTALPPTLRSNTVIISSDYGPAGALAIYGDPRALPVVLSPQLSEWFWLPPGLTATEALMVGYAPSELGFMCSSATVVTHLTVPYEVVNLEQGAPVTDCHLNGPISTIWGRLKNFA